MISNSRLTKGGSKHKSRTHQRIASDDDSEEDIDDDDDDDDDDNNDSRSLQSVHRKTPSEHSIGKQNFPSKLTATYLIQQQVERKNTRMSIEKQKFFRHSAFNSRTMKKENAANAIDKMFSEFDDQYSNNASAIATKTTGYKSGVMLSDGSSSATDEEDDDDEDEDDENEDEDDGSDGSSSESCSSSSSSYNDDSDSSTSSNSGSSDNETNTDEEPEQSKPTKSNTPAMAKASTRSATNAAAAAAAAAAATASMTDTNTWGFAAEAKKNLDIFRRSATSLGDRVFGNFDGIDKFALVKTSANNSEQKFTASIAANTRLSSQASNALPVFGRTESLRSSGTTTTADHRSAGRRKTKTQSQKEQTNERDQRQRSHNASKKTENNTIVKGRTNNKKLNVFAFDDTDNTTKANIKLFTHPKTSTTTKTTITTNATASTTKHDSKRGSTTNTTTTNTETGLPRTPATSSNRLTNITVNSRKSQILSDTRAKDTRNPTTATINNNLNSIRNNNNNTSHNNLSSANKAGTRRVTLVSLPLEPKLVHYDSSSDDEIPYLRTPSTSHVKDSLDFATLRERSDFNSIGMSSKYPMLSSLSPHTPPYNKTQSMGKKITFSPLSHFIQFYNQIPRKKTNKKRSTATHKPHHNQNSKLIDITLGCYRIPRNVAL